MSSRTSKLLSSRQRKSHPWTRPDEQGDELNQQIHRQTQRLHPSRGATYRRTNMHISLESEKSISEPLNHPEEPGAIPKRKSPINPGVSPRNQTVGTTFQQYRQQQSVRKHPWRTDVKSRGSLRRGARSWRSLVRAPAPWDEAAVCPSIMEEDEEELIARTESKESETSLDCAISMAEDIVREVHGRKERENTEATPQDDFLLNDLRNRLRRVYQGDHHVVYGTGTGKGKKPPTGEAEREREMAVREQLVRALQERLQSYYTGHLVALEAYGKRGGSALLQDASNESKEEGNSDDGSAISVDESVMSVQSMIVAATILNSVGSHPLESHPMDDDEWTEYTVDSQAFSSARDNSNKDGKTQLPQGGNRAAQIARLKASLPSVARGNSPENEWDEHTVLDSQIDEEEWEEETVATAALTQSQKIKLQKSLLPRATPLDPPTAQDVGNDDEWDEYTVETAALPESARAAMRATQEAEWDEYTVESSFVPTHVSSSNRQLEQPRHCTAHEAEEDVEWDEYTVETIADALLSLPNAFQTHKTPQSRVVRSVERTGSSDAAKSPSSLVETVKNIVEDSKNRLAQFEEYEEETVSYVDEIIEDEYDDDDHWDDYTVETVADAFASLPRTLQLEFLRTAVSTHNSVALPVEDDDGSSACSSAPPDEAYQDTQQPQSESETYHSDEWTEVTCEQTIRDIPEILRRANSVKSASSRSTSGGMKPIVMDPTLSSTDSESETWHDALSSGSSGPSSIKEVSSVCSSASKRSCSTARHRRARSPPSNINQVLQKDIFSRDLVIVEGALRSLTQKADDDLEYRAHIVRSGGILAIVRAMQQNVYNSTIQVLACETLGKIATDPENRVAIGEVGGVEAVVGAMSEHMAEEFVAEATCGTLWILTSQCPSNQLSIEAAALDVVVSCMRRYARNAVIQEKAFQTLANLCLESEEKLVALSQMGGFVVMSAALVLHWEHPTVKNEAISTLALLFGRLAAYQTA